MVQFQRQTLYGAVYIRAIETKGHIIWVERTSSQSGKTIVLKWGTDGNLRVSGENNLNEIIRRKFPSREGLSTLV